MRPERAAAFVLCALIVISCGRESDRQDANPVPQKGRSPVVHARRFSIERSAAGSTVYVMGDRSSYDTTQVFVLYGGNRKPREQESATYVAVPCRKVASLSSIYTQMLFELGRLGNVAAIDNLDYVVNDSIRSYAGGARLPELAKNPEIDLEQTIALKPDIVFTFGMGTGTGIDPRLAQAHIPVAVSVDHLEESPLARAEWIKFIAEFVGAAETADSIFRSVETEYRRLCQLTAAVERRPTVLTEVKYGDVWYMPGGRSNMSRLLGDAGADYLWKDDRNFGSLPLSFEEVLLKARGADYWLNLSAVKSRAHLLALEPRHAAFSAYMNGNLYNNTKRRNMLGYSAYWESGMIHPERILSDLVMIFHPGLTDTAAGMHYYEKIKQR